MNAKLADISIKSQSIPMKTKVTYSRDEKYDAQSILIPRYGVGTYTLMNKTSRFIYENIDGKKSVSDLYKLIIDKFGGQYSTQITKDLSYILNEFWKSNLIKWKDGAYPNMENFEIFSNDIKIKIAFDEDLKNIQNYVKDIPQENLLFRNLLGDSDTSTLQIRNNIFNMTSIFILFYKENQLQGMLSITPKENSTVMIIDFISSSAELFVDNFSKSLELVGKLELGLSTKVRIFLSEDEEISLVKTIEGLGFNKICELEKEFGHKTFIQCDYFL